MTGRRLLRVALLAWPRGHREEIGAEILQTAEAGGSVAREACALVAAGARVRVRHGGPDLALRLGGLLVLAAALAPGHLWMSSDVRFADGATASGAQLQAWPVRELLAFVAALAVARLGRSTFALLGAVPLLAVAAERVLPDPGVGYGGLTGGEALQVAAASVVAAGAGLLVARLARGRPAAARRRGAALSVLVCLLAGLPGSLDRPDLGPGGVAYAGSWLGDLGPAVPVALAGAMLLVAALLPDRTARPLPTPR